MTALARMLDTLEVEQHGRLGGRDRLACIVFPNGSIAMVPPFLAQHVWLGMRDA